MRVNKTSKSGKAINHLRQTKNPKSRQGYVEKLEKLNSTQLRADDNDSSRLISIDIVYDKLQNMREEYKHFYSEEQNFEEAWSLLQDDPEHFIEHLIEIFEAHNHVVEALNEFDKIFETNHLDALIEFIKHYESDFHVLSILIQPDSSLRVRNRKLKEHFNKRPEAFTFLSKPGGFLRKLFDFYHKLKAIKPPTTQDEDQLAWYQGLFMDQKA